MLVSRFNIQKSAGIYICLCFFCLSPGLSVFVSAQKISGHVLNEGGKAASYVKVQFNKSNSVFTNMDGSFIITAKRLPDTLFFSAPGFEPYKVFVTEEMTKDQNFEVVLLNTRRKIKSSEVISNSVSGNKNNSTLPGNPSEDKTNGISSQGNSTPTSGSYISGKKLFMTDTIANNSSVIYRSGLLTAGEVNDFGRWKMWEDFGENEFKTYSDHWKLYPTRRYSVQLQNKDHRAIINHPVFLINKKTNDTAWSAITDNTGKAELWAAMKDSADGSAYRISCNEAADINSPVLFADGINKMELNVACSVPATVDIVMVVDATGSMSTEIDFLKIELEEVIRNTFAEYKDLDMHVGSVFYRDRGDEYITRYVNFQTDLLKVLNFIKLQRASGGGDVPEAVHTALQTALDSLHWSENARSRLLFLVTDAPPHDEAKEKMFQLIQKAAAKGVRIVPVICKGADKSTEFIMRSIALATNGTYVFLTDDANAEFAGSKLTTHVFNVQYLNSLLENIIKQVISADDCDKQGSIDISKNTPANIENIVTRLNPATGTFTIESKNYLKEVFITDFTGKILTRLETQSKQNKWAVNLSTYPNGTFLVKYITPDDQWGAEKFVLNH